MSGGGTEWVSRISSFGSFIARIDLKRMTSHVVFRSLAGSWVHGEIQCAAAGQARRRLVLRGRVLEGFGLAGIRVTVR
jgi:hypothetical protein